MDGLFHSWTRFSTHKNADDRLLWSILSGTHVTDLFDSVYHGDIDHAEVNSKPPKSMAVFYRWSWKDLAIVNTQKTMWIVFSLFFTYFSGETTMCRILKEVLVANRGLPSRQFDRRWEDSNLSPPGWNATTLIVWLLSIQLLLSPFVFLVQRIW